MHFSYAYFMPRSLRPKKGQKENFPFSKKGLVYIVFCTLINVDFHRGTNICDHLDKCPTLTCLELGIPLFFK